MLNQRILFKKFVVQFFAMVFMAIAVMANSLEVVDKTVAVVEEDVILESELRRRLNHVIFLNPDSRNDDAEALKAKVLQQLIDEQLQRRIAQRANVVVTDEEVNGSLEDFERRLKNSNSSIDAYLQSLSISEQQVQEQIRRDLALQKVQQGSLNQRITITNREVDQFLESKAGQDWVQPRFNVGHILLALSPDLNEDVLAAQAQDIRSQLQLGATDFKQAAINFSKGPNAASGGDLGWRSPEQLPVLFSQQLSPLKPGQVTDVFRSNAGFHILKLYQRSGAEPVYVERSKARHILVKVSELFTEEEAKNKIDALYQRALGDEDFEQLAKDNTDDTASKLSGGDLGWSTPGQFVPEFEQAMNNTAVGELGAPFRSPFGWHILKVDDRRVDNMFETVKRNQVRNILRNQRFQDELQIWLLELRENAYIKKIS